MPSPGAQARGSTKQVLGALQALCARAMWRAVWGEHLWRVVCGDQHVGSNCAGRLGSPLRRGRVLCASLASMPPGSPLAHRAKPGGVPGEAAEGAAGRWRCVGGRAHRRLMVRPDDMEAPGAEYDIPTSRTHEGQDHASAGFLEPLVDASPPSLPALPALRNAAAVLLEWELVVPRPARAKPPVSQVARR